MSVSHDPDISILLCAHDEGMLVHPTVRSALRARSAIEAAGATTEFIVVLDDADPKTREYFDHFAKRLQGRGLDVFETHFGDPGMARNFAAARSRGHYIALLDGDDIWCNDWLLSAHRAATADRRRIVWHPEFSITFGEENHITMSIDMEDPSFRVVDLAFDNFWSALAFAERSIFLDTPYRISRIESGFGFEDWTWNCDTIERGALHKLVPQTSHFVRKKKSAVSVSGRSKLNDCLPLPSDLFHMNSRG